MAKNTAKSKEAADKAEHSHQQKDAMHITEHKFCSGCATKIHKEAHMCPKCGLPAFSTTEKSQVTAGLLALFLGGFGVHKFYLGKGGQGVLYILFFWTFIPAIVALIEAIIYFTATPEKWQKIVQS